MPALQQYLDLYEAQRSLLDAHGAPLLNAARPAAASRLRQASLLTPKDFSHVSPEALLAPDYALNIARHNVPTQRSDLFTCAVPELSTDTHFLVNEQYVSGSQNEPASHEWYAGSLRTFVTQYPEVAARYYDQLACRPATHYDPRSAHTSVSSHHPVAENALSTLLCQDGFVLYVPEGVTVERPLQLIALLRAVDDFMAVQRVLIIVENRAKASVLMCQHASQLSAASLLSLSTMEIYVGEGASLDFYTLEEHHEGCRQLSTCYVSQQASSSFTLGNYTLTAGQTRNRTYVDLNGEHATTCLYGLCIADNSQRVDNFTFIAHHAAQCTSNELFKYVLSDEARASFVGRILVEKGAIGTDARQTDRNLCLSPSAKMTARPELEIYADDVKCAHGATVGQLDQQALFYMRTRGIPEAEARLLLMSAFMCDVIEGIQLIPLQDRLKHLVEKRFRGELSHCKTCQIKK